MLYLNETSEQFHHKLGVGYYVNREHEHVDIREKPLYWVDKSGSGPPDYDKNKPHPVEAFFLHYDARIAPSRPGGMCPTMGHEDTQEGEEIETEDFEFRWKNVLFTEPPLNGSPASRKRFKDIRIDFTPLPQLDVLEQL